MSTNNGCLLSKETIQLPLREISQPRIIASESSIKKIPRKSSFNFNSNSSDDLPSPHASIYEAIHISANSSEDNGHKIELINIPPRRSGSASKGRNNDENLRDTQTNHVTRPDDTEFLYGRGTVLDTISEQKSFTTMRTIARSKSVEDLGSSAFIQRQDSLNISNSLHRKRSFSVDDIDLIKRSYHEACVMIERKALKLLPGHQIYAQPKIPLEAAPKRPNTPPGMPSWTEAQNLPLTHIGFTEESSIRNRLQRRNGLPASKLNQYSYLPQDSTTQIQTNTNNSRGHLAPRFRPPKSTYTSLNQHPFFNTCLQKARPCSRSHDTEFTPDRFNIPLRNISRGNRKKAPHVRFTPSTVARDSEMISDQIQHVTENAAASFPSSPMKHMKVTASKCAYLRDETKKTKIMCPHSKGRRVALRKLINSDASTGSNWNLKTKPLDSYRDIVSIRSVSGLSVPLSINSNHEPFQNVTSTRSASLSSSTALMSSARLPAIEDIRAIDTSEEKVSFCWKCKVEHALNKFDQLWFQAVSYLTSCCGFDKSEDCRGETIPHILASVGSENSRASRGSVICVSRDAIMHENIL